ncbi:MAG: tRNA (N6-threonylcarbamoyladenosine(37)-N6)-methyltransferase TrmO [Bacteroidales bacterium]|nr:tRNA (N6-threonylcarbamoyladenosine(37)-N6)-methyltransferase TrmO [Bacteroidales bacterium]
MTLEPVATFHSPLSSKFGIPRQSGLVPALKGEIRLEGRFRREEALRGLEGFSHLWLIWGFSANRETASDSLLVRPPRLGGNRSVGVFASRSPYRPNPIGLSSVRIEAIDAAAGIIRVSGADLMDGTPVYDIKPYVKYTDSHPDARSGFVDETPWQPLEVVIPAALESRFSPQDLAALRQLLAQDPRPAYQDSDKAYGFPFAGYDVSFTVAGSVLTVLDCVPVVGCDGCERGRDQ